MRRPCSTARLALVATALLAASLGGSRAGAQALGPQRQFLAIEPYYEFTRVKLDQSTTTDAGSTATTNGYGLRLWINGAPFHFPVNSSIALFTTYAPSTSETQASVLQYGAQIDQFFVRRPFGGVLDPFVSVGLGAYRRHIDKDVVGFVDGGSTNTHFALSPGGGVRIPLPNRFEIRGDVRDLILIDGRTTLAGSETSHNLVVQGALGITF